MAAETTPPPEGGPDPRCRRNLAAGMTVEIVLKQDQRSVRTVRGTVRGTVRDLLTRSARHPHGIKVLWFKKDGHPAKSHLTKKEEVR